LVSSDPTLGHIDEFDYYVRDLADFIAGPVSEARRGATSPLFILAHSMGGTIATLYLEGEPGSAIRAATLVTPMMEPWAAGGESPGVIEKLVDTLCDRFSVSVGAIPGVSTTYVQGAPFEKQYKTFLNAPEVTPNGTSHSRVRLARNWETRDAARCVDENCGSPDARVGGASARWLNQSCRASERARGQALSASRSRSCCCKVDETSRSSLLRRHSSASNSTKAPARDTVSDAPCPARNTPC
jgi:lysophospholipase